MANEEHKKILKTGRVKWNKWRKNYPSIIPNLRRATLDHLDLSKYDFHDALLNHVNFEGTDLRNCDFRWADLRDGILTDADISYADLRDANIYDCYLSDTKQEGTLFTLSDHNLDTIFAGSGDDDHD